MHRTQSVDYALVLEGEITLLLDKEELLMRQGDFLVERGTSHAWANRSSKPCKMLFVLTVLSSRSWHGISSARTEGQQPAPACANALRELLPSRRQYGVLVAGGLETEVLTRAMRRR